MALCPKTKNVFLACPNFCDKQYPGAILKIDYPPWLPPTVSPVTTPGSLPQPPGFLEVHSFELIAAGVGYAVAGVTGAILGFVGGTLFKGSQLQI